MLRRALQPGRHPVEFLETPFPPRSPRRPLTFVYSCPAPYLHLHPRLPSSSQFVTAAPIDTNRLGHTHNASLGAPPPPGWNQPSRLPSVDLFLATPECAERACGVFELLLGLSPLLLPI